MLLGCITAFFSGNLAFHLSPALVPAFWLAWLIVSLLSLSLCFKTKSRVIILAAIIGYLQPYIFVSWHNSSGIQLSNQDSLKVTAEISSLPRAYGSGSQFALNVLQIQDKAQEKGLSPYKILAFWPNSTTEQLAPGQVWQFKLKTKQLHGLANPGGSDQALRLRAQGFAAQAKVLKSPKPKLISQPKNPLTLSGLRFELLQHLEQQLKDFKYKGVILGLVLGERYQMPHQQMRLFQETGTAHLLAISGLHIGLVAMSLYAFVLCIWPKFSRFNTLISGQSLAAYTACISAISYAALAGFSVATTRACIMVVVFALGVLLRRHIPVWNRYAIALFVVVLINPLAPLSPGFWLSFVAVAILILALQHRLKTLTGFKAWWQVQCVISFALLPIIFSVFNMTPMVSPLANFIAIPLFSFVVVPLSLIATLVSLFMPGVSHFMFLLADKSLSLCLLLLDYLSDLTINHWHVGYFNLVMVVLALLGISILLLPRGLPARYCGLLLILPFIFNSAISTPSFGGARLTLLDVGQGLAAVVQTQKHSLIFDTGPQSRSGYNAGEQVIMPFLRHEGINKPTTLIVSHGDLDHRGGAESLLKEYPHINLLTSAPEWFSGYSLQECQQQSWQWEGVDFAIIHPDLNFKGSKNDRSCVLRVSTQSQAVLLTGDIEAKAERYLLKQHAKQLPAQTIIAPHHGSLSSSTTDFITKVSPEVVLFPVGFHNQYHFPREEVVARYVKVGAEVYDTVHSGAISLSLNSSHPKINSYRNSYYYQISQKYFSPSQPK